MRDESARLVARIIVLAAVVIGAVVATAKAGSWWTVALAVAALVLAAGGVAASVGTMLRADDAPQALPARRVGAAFAVVAVVAVALAIALPREESVAMSSTGPGARAAAQTVRDFLASAVLDDNAYAACEYLTPSAQQQVARLAGGDQTCRDALTATEPSFAGIGSEGALHALRLRAVERDGSAFVTAVPRGRRPVTFLLPRTTGSEAAAFKAPPAAWRIAHGATAVLGS
jgi:hypothetical protein